MSLFAAPLPKEDTLPNITYIIVKIKTIPKLAAPINSNNQALSNPVCFLKKGTAILFTKSNASPFPIWVAVIALPIVIAHTHVPSADNTTLNKPYSTIGDIKNIDSNNGWYCPRQTEIAIKVTYIVIAALLLPFWATNIKAIAIAGNINNESNNLK